MLGENSSHTHKEKGVLATKRGERKPMKEDMRDASSSKRNNDFIPVLECRPVQADQWKKVSD
jgi:hypothetical protein